MKAGFFLGRLLNHKEYNSFRSKFRCNMVVFYVIQYVYNSICQNINISERI